MTRPSGELSTSKHISRVLAKVAVQFEIVGHANRGEAMRPFPDILDDQAHIGFVGD
jgi:hypothetical protein